MTKYREFIISSLVLFLTSCGGLQTYRELRTIEELREKYPMWGRSVLDSAIFHEQKLIKLDSANEKGWYYYLTDLLRLEKLDGFQEKIDSASRLINNPHVEVGRFVHQNWISTLKVNYQIIADRKANEQKVLENWMNFKKAIDSLPDPARVEIKTHIDGREIRLIRDNANDCWMNVDNYDEKFIHREGIWYRMK